jgi:hypothetical protein
VFVTGNLGFVFGTPFDLAAEFGMGIQAGSSGGVGTANATLGGSIRWLGFEAVETSGGAPVANFAVASASGTNYAAALPEPLGLISVAMLAAALRRGRRA